MSFYRVVPTPVKLHFWKCKINLDINLISPLKNKPNKVHISPIRTKENVDELFDFAEKNSKKLSAYKMKFVDNAIISPEYLCFNTHTKIISGGKSHELRSLKHVQFLHFYAINKTKLHNALNIANSYANSIKKAV